MERAGVVLTATNTIMGELAQDWSWPEGSGLLETFSARCCQSSDSLNGYLVSA
jgi:hypothetical protein